jgi:hypothetical protein
MGQKRDEYRVLVNVMQTIFPHIWFNPFLPENWEKTEGEKAQ